MLRFGYWPNGGHGCSVTDLLRLPYGLITMPLLLVPGSADASYVGPRASDEPDNSQTDLGDDGAPDETVNRE
jgi:hypothetical protein